MGKYIMYKEVALAHNLGFLELILRRNTDGYFKINKHLFKKK